MDRFKAPLQNIKSNGLEKITRPEPEAQFTHLDAPERFGAAVAEEKNVEPEKLMEDLLDRAANEKPRFGDERPTQTE